MTEKEGQSQESASPQGFSTARVSEMYQANKQVIMGGGTVAILVIALFVFLDQKSSADSNAAWKLFHETRESGADAEAWRALIPDVEGSDVEPWARYQLAVRLFDDKEYAEALSTIESVAADFPDHYLSKANMIGEDISIFERVRERISTENEWATKHPQPTENAAPPSGQTATITTDKGTIVLGLYTDLAPESCKRFIQLAAGMEGTVFKTAQEGIYIKGAEPAEGDGLLSKLVDKMTPEDDLFPPLEESAKNLYHFANSVSFDAGLSSDENGPGTFNVSLDQQFYKDGDETVFATILEGDEILSDATEREKTGQELVEPVKIESVTFSITAEGFDVDALQSEAKALLAEIAEAEAAEEEKEGEGAEGDGDEGDGDGEAEGDGDEGDGDGEAEGGTDEDESSGG